ncbi:MAG: PAS domain-containing protein [Rhodospirillaceae bacterium]|jgi:hypothetical protein|nr:PAS domain-containing protein [Rhodospirillaceae bacterium]MBT6138606.1 PAS domain-containing protein [Rhodospirillaceae bacterium]
MPSRSIPPIPPQSNYRRLDSSDIPDGHPVSGFGAYFLSTRRDDGKLHRADFDPLELVRLMPWLQILEPAGQSDFRYRLSGTLVVDMLKADLTGKMLSQIVDREVMDVRRGEIQDVFSTHAPVFSVSELNFPGREFVTVYRGLFPGASDTGDLVFFITAPVDARVV